MFLYKEKFIAIFATNINEIFYNFASTVFLFVVKMSERHFCFIYWSTQNIKYHQT